MAQHLECLIGIRRCCHLGASRASRANAPSGEGVVTARRGRSYVLGSARLPIGGLAGIGCAPEDFVPDAAEIALHFDQMSNISAIDWTDAIRNPVTPPTAREASAYAEPTMALRFVP